MQTRQVPDKEAIEWEEPLLLAVLPPQNNVYSNNLRITIKHTPAVQWRI